MPSTFTLFWFRKTSVTIEILWISFRVPFLWKSLQFLQEFSLSFPFYCGIRILVLFFPRVLYQNKCQKEEKSVTPTWLTSVDITVASTADENHNVGWKLLIFHLSLGYLRYCDVYRYESGRCHTLPFFLTFFIISRFSFYITRINNEQVSKWLDDNVCTRFLPSFNLQKKKQLIKWFLYIG